jgi:hypothetical protein
MVRQCLFSGCHEEAPGEFIADMIGGCSRIKRHDLFEATWSAEARREKPWAAGRCLRAKIFTTGQPA